MNMTTQDYVKKALLDTQERIRDYMNYADHVENKKLRKFFEDFAELEGFQAQRLQGFLEKADD
jgi:rubrerythrin